jgi:hypothetical protein
MVNKRDTEVFIVCLSCHFDVGLFHVIGQGGMPFFEAFMTVGKAPTAFVLPYERDTLHHFYSKRV